MVNDYAIEFCTIAADRGGIEPALIDAFLNSLSETLKDHMAVINLPADLEKVNNLASKMGETVNIRSFGFSTITSGLFLFTSNEFIPPETNGHVFFSPTENEGRKEGRCIYCSQFSVVMGKTIF